MATKLDGFQTLQGAYQEDTQSFNVTSTGGTLVREPFDYVAATYPAPDTEVYTYKQGGASGDLVATVTVTYTDASKENLLSVLRS